MPVFVSLVLDRPGRREAASRSYELVLAGCKPGAASIFSGSRCDGIYTSLVRILTLNFLHTCVRADAGLNLV
jgi:hypothetical protein